MGNNGLQGLATGIGSLPYDDVDQALDSIFSYFHEIPFWPQLPKRDPREGMVSQFIEHIPCMKWFQDGIVFDARRSDKELEDFYDRLIAVDTEYFQISRAFASGLHGFYERLGKMDLSRITGIKCHITGPFTFAASVKDENGAALLHNPVFMQVIIKALTMKALWQIKLFKKFNKKIIVFLDEPYLGCFGSAYTPVNREEVVNGLAEITESIKAEGALSGVHCCGNTDWSIFTDVKTMDIINFDAFGFLDRVLLYADSLKLFLQRGGMLCWGIVPTQDFSAGLTADDLLKKIESGLGVLEKKGLPAKTVLENMLLSPSCGLGALDTDAPKKIFSLLSKLSSRVRAL
ncbi:MAG: hypothetical protein WC335_04580 [Candidatus Omnitrophota bacterium]|jgi:hypothetical protein